MWQQRFQCRKDRDRQDSADALDVNAMTRLTRRQLLRRGTVLGASVFSVSVLGSLITGCSEPTNPSMRATLDLGTEPGVLNYAYALFQLEADFYARVTSFDGATYPGMLVSEWTAFTQFSGEVTSARDDLRANHIPAGRITDVILFRLGTAVNFSDRTSVLTHAQIIEETSARALQTLRSRLTTPALQTLLTPWTTEAQARASTIDSWMSTTFTPGPIDPVTAMATLAPYLLTQFTVTHA
jgi:hypothetical protein